MPFTPFHIGIGAALKAIAPRHFSFTVFAFAQVLTDVEVLIHMTRPGAALHQHLHTPFGAAGIAAVSFAVGRPVCERALRWWHSADVQGKEYYDPVPDISWFAALNGAFWGAFSHLLLDAMMHADVRPLWPWSMQNPFLGWLQPGTLHLLCFLAGVAGAVICARWRKGSL